jgi:phosphoribosyl 1,2-cyclic phosphate phosphodiesterase
MKFNLLGSGGASKFPRPTCFCPLCEKARQKGAPYIRTGPSLYLYDDAILFDTPEEVADQLNRERIKKVNNVFYTHWHPDHTQGMRLFEHLGCPNRLEDGQEEKVNEPVNVYLPEDVLPDFREYLPTFFYFEQMGWMKIKKTKDRQKVNTGRVAITPLNIGRGKDRVRYTYLIEKDGRRVVYAPCSIYQIKLDQHYENLDLIFIETGWFGDTQKLRAKLPKNHVWQDHISFEENLDLVRKIRPKRTILTHLEGTRHVDYDQIKKKIKPHDRQLNLEVGYDGMILAV